MSAKPKLCLKCGMRRRVGAWKWCRPCKDGLPPTPLKGPILPDDQRLKSNCRSYANTYQKRGHLIPQPCQVCGGSDAEKHHPDYSQPLLVEWMCRPCHMAHHDNLNGKPIIERRLSV